MKKQPPLKQRMYSLVIYQLTGIQKGIQSYHATIEYQLKYGNTPEYLQWAKKDKTVILLNGGTTNQANIDCYSQEYYTGTMDEALNTLAENGIPYMEFYEPDLNNSMTAISFLVDERVWDRDKYPDVTKETLGLDPRTDRTIVTRKIFEEYIKLYGEKIAFLRTWTRGFQLASN